eukprot:g7297.t1
MVRLTFLLVCVCLTATYATASSGINEVPDVLNFLGYRVYGGSASFSAIGDIYSCPVKPWSAAQTAARVKTVKVVFPKAYCMPPVVSISITQLDTNKNYNLRYKALVIEVTNEYAVIEFSTWCNTYIYSSVVTYTISGFTSKEYLESLMAATTSLET